MGGVPSLQKVFLPSCVEYMKLKKNVTFGTTLNIKFILLTFFTSLVHPRTRGGQDGQLTWTQQDKGWAEGTAALGASEQGDIEWT